MEIFFGQKMKKINARLAGVMFFLVGLLSFGLITSLMPKNIINQANNISQIDNPQTISRARSNQLAVGTNLNRIADWSTQMPLPKAPGHPCITRRAAALKK